MTYTWQKYLRYLKANAQRKALQGARLSAKKAEALPRRGNVDGQGGVQVEYIALTPQPSWTEEDLARYEALADGGEWVA